MATDIDMMRRHEGRQEKEELKHVLNKPWVLASIDAVSLSKCILSLPIIGFVVCVALSIIFDFEKSTATHCGVANYLPSISSAIGGFKPQIYIWRTCIALHCGPRIILCVGSYYKDYASFDIFLRSTLYSTLVRINALLHLVENSALVLLSMISSTENYHVHENCFITFMITSEVYMLCTIFLFRWSRSSTGWTDNDSKSYAYKSLLFVINFSSFMSAIYFFFRHNSYCEPGVYTLFAGCEYVVVITNILFHGTAIFDFHGGQFQSTGRQFQTPRQSEKYT